MGWLLGVYYDDEESDPFLEDLGSVMWLTYRSGFVPMEPYGITSDSGWGCMLRASQMLMAQALQRHFLGRDWRPMLCLELRRECPIYVRLLHWFLDQPGEVREQHMPPGAARIG